MTLVRWQPYRDMINLKKSFDKVFGKDLFDEEDRALTTCSWYPAADVFENENEYVFKMELPGVNKDDIKIEFESGNLTIRGEKKQEQEVKEENFHRFERCFGTFVRSFSMPRNVDDKNISASMKDGVLELKVPKSEEAKPKTISINVK